MFFTLLELLQHSWRDYVLAHHWCWDERQMQEAFTYWQLEAERLSLDLQSHD